MNSILPVSLAAQTLEPMMPQPPQQLAAILFDLDGTLVNTDPLHFQIWQTMLREHGFNIDETFYKQRISGRLNPDIMADLLPHLPAAEQAQFAAEKEAQFRVQAETLQPLAGLAKLLRWLGDRALPHAVVTNAPADNARHMLRVLDLEQQFDAVIIAEELGIGKPDPAPYRAALAALGVAAAQAIAFEDSPSGTRSAVGAGVFTIGMASTQTPETLHQAGAALVIDDFTAPQLWAVLPGA